MKTSSCQRIAEWFLRIALATSLLSAVADRVGLWGPPGSANASWGDWPHFLAYSAKLNGWMPAALQPAAAWIATLAEVALGILLLIPGCPRWGAILTGALLAIFALAMTFTLGVKPPLSYSVWTAAGGAFLLAAIWERPTTLGAKAP